MQVTSKSLKRQASKVLKSAKKHSKVKDPRVDLVLLALHGGKMGFDKIIAMIDGLVTTLKTEQGDDDAKKAYCAAEFDKSEDEKKELELDISDLDKAIADGKESFATLTSEIEALTEGIKELDKSVAEATDTRKEEHDEYVSTLSSNSAAKELLAFAKNRLNKFYNPKMYKAPPKRELSEEESLTVSMGGTLAPTAAPGGIAGTGIGLVQLHRVAPPPPPEANLAYKKSGESSNGVLAMIDLMVADIDKEIQIMEVEEADAQKEYEELIKDSAAKRAQDSKSITDKESAKAETEAEVEANTQASKGKKTELMETDKYIAGLHAECDWLVKFYDARKEARDGEIESLGKAKDVLSGADYSLVQMGRSTHLRGARHA
jgi:DNA repair exonuclease SbcCD ATPase subunit